MTAAEPSSQHPAVAAVIVTHRSSGTLPGLLRSLAEHEPELDIVIVDSGTPGGPPSTEIPTVALPVNVGFGEACTRGAEEVLGARSVDYLMFLNPDVRLVGPSLSQLAASVSQRPETGIASGPLVDSAGRRQPAAWGPPSPSRAFWYATGWQFARLRHLLGKLELGGPLTSSASLANDAIRVDGHVLGGAMVVRRECWEQLGGFDDDFFLYWEDADLCQRARNLGWKVAVLPCTPIVHIAGTSSHGVNDQQRWNWYLDGAKKFASKHLTPAQSRRLLRALRLGRLIAQAR